MKRLLLLAYFAVCLLIPACASAELDIVAMNYPIYDFATHIAGDDAGITLLIPPGTEVHAFDPSPKDMIRMQNCDMVFYIGGENDVWAETLLGALSEGPETVRLIDGAVTLYTEEDEDEYDEHIWTDPQNAVAMMQMICEAMCNADPEHADGFRERSAAYIAEIEAVDARLQSIAEKAPGALLIFADRFPMMYFTKRFGFTAIAAFPGCSSETEPSAAVMKTLVDAVKDGEAACVYTIEMSNGRVASVVAEETGCSVYQLHSIQNVTKDEMEAGETYVSLMNRNADVLEESIFR